MKLFGGKEGGIPLPSSTRRYAPLLIILCVILGLLPVITQKKYALGLGCLIMIYSTLAMSVDLLSGYMGLSSLGHAGFFGFSAYAAGYFSVNMGLPHGVAVLLALLGAVLLAMLFGFIANRVWGNTFMIVNMALGQCIWGLAFKMTRITNGETGLLGIKRPTFFGIDFSKITPFFYLVFVVFIIVVFFVYRYVNSPFQLTVKGIRQSKTRMSALGYDIYKHKFIAYVISGTLAGVAGIMYCFYMRFVSPSDCNTIMSSKAFLMAMVGGTGTLGGSIIGATLIVILENVVSSVTERWTMCLGILYIVTVMCSPRGIIGLYHDVREWIEHRRKEKTAKAIETAEQSKQMKE